MVVVMEGDDDTEESADFRHRDRISLKDDRTSLQTRSPLPQTTIAFPQAIELTTENRWCSPTVGNRFSVDGGAIGLVHRVIDRTPANTLIDRLAELTNRKSEQSL